MTILTDEHLISIKQRTTTNKGTTNDSQNFAPHSVVTAREIVTQCGKINTIGTIKLSQQQQ
jgi:hypothetical protein